jgi:pimeloyl-ACP methyl ester carboxylesterase
MKKTRAVGMTRLAILLVLASHLLAPAYAADTAAHGAGRSWSFAGLASPVKVASAKDLGSVLTKSLRPTGGAAAAQAAGLDDVQLAAVIQRTADAAAHMDGAVTVAWDAETGSLKLTSGAGETIAVSAEAPALGSAQAAKIERLASSLRSLDAFGDVGQTINAAFTPAFDAHDGAADLKLLVALNADLVKTPRTQAQLRAQGVIADGSQTVTRQSDERQIMPFREVLLPAAKTGMYAPKKQVPESQVERVILFMPGIGTDISNAKTVLDIAGTFNKKGSLSYALDVTLNGMGKAMPFSFGTAEGMDAVAHHAVQVLKALHPGKPVFVAGRSQGGLVAVEYASRHDDVAGAIGLSPSHPDATIVKESIPWAENHPTLKIWPKAWEAYKQFTTAFQAAVAVSKVPVMLLLDRGDDAYPQPMYYEAWSRWAARQPGLRTLATFANAASAERHNLWLRDARNNPIYDRVIDTMVEFFKASAAVKPEVIAPAATAVAETPAAKGDIVAQMASRVTADFSRKLKTITIESDEFDPARADEIVAEARRLGVNELIVQDPNKAQAEAMLAKGALPTVDWVHWKRDAVGVEEYLSEFDGQNRGAMRKRIEAGKDVQIVVNKFSAEDYAKVWKIWKQEIGSRPDALQFVPGVDVWPQDFAEKLLAGKTGDPTHGVAEDWIIITAHVDGKVAGGMVAQKRWDRGLLHGRMGAYLPEYVGRKDRTPAGMTPKNYFIEFNLSLKLMEEARKAGIQASKGSDTGQPGYGTDVMLMHSKFDEVYEAFPELHPLMRLVVNPGPNDYVIPTFDMGGLFLKRYFAEREAGRKPLGRDIIGSFVIKNGWLTTKPEILDAFYLKRDVTLSYEHVASLGNVREQLIGRKSAKAITDGTGQVLVRAGEAFDAQAVERLKGSRVKAVKLIVEPAARQAHARALLSGKVSAETGKPLTEAEIDALAAGGASTVKIKVGKPGNEMVTELDIAHENVRGLSENGASLLGRRPAADVVDGTGAMLLEAGVAMTAKDVGRLVQSGVTALTLAVDEGARAARAKELLLKRVLAADVLGKNGKPVARARQMLDEALIAKIVESGAADVQVYSGNPALDRIWGPFLHFTNDEFKPKVPRSLKLQQRPIARENGA